MAAARYRYGHTPPKHRPRKVLFAVICTVILLAVAGWFVILDLRRQASEPVEGQARVVSQVLGEQEESILISEPAFTMKLPSDWKEIGRNRSSQENSISWQASKKGEDNRWLTLYIDTIPANKPLNRLLPLTVNGNQLTPGNVSENCARFTGGGSLNAQEATKLQPTIAKWEGMDFMCNLPNIVDNVIGTGSLGSANATTVSGLSGSTHRYFFVFTDRNIHPNYSILTDAIRSFSAK